MLRLNNFKSVMWAVVLSGVFLVPAVRSHCQIPCGIYGDKMRFEIMAEHVRTIEKSMEQIVELDKAEKADYNQIVRWVTNKDKHADELSELITYYFMAQRVKIADKADARAYEKYVKKLTLLHEMLVYSMKCKQGTELSNVGKLRGLLSEFDGAYFD